MENGISRREVIVGAGAAATVGVISHFLGSEAFAQPSQRRGRYVYAQIAAPPLSRGCAGTRN